MPSQPPLQKINNLSSLLAQPAKQLTTQQQQLLQNPDFLQIVKQVMTGSYCAIILGEAWGAHLCRSWSTSVPREGGGRWFIPFSSNLCEGSTIHIVAVVLISQF